MTAKAVVHALLLLVVGCVGPSTQEPAEGGEEAEATKEIAYDPHAFDTLADKPLKFYLQAQDALAHDRFEPVQTALLAMADVAEGQLAELAVRAAGGEDIRQVRIAFKPVSEALIAEGVPEGYGIAYCPMAFNYKGANWAQRTEGEIMNPYYGDNMLHCGYLEDEDEADTTITN